MQSPAHNPHSAYALQPLHTPANIGLLVVPEKAAYVIERFGRFQGTLEAGLHFLIPFVSNMWLDQLA